ncbi:MAG: FKBP-type peptidyl-prolyl cis-trans isomerase [Candidatus Vogelbacteria bacterium]|nr:FKBP-type peptidyl-prolyl cis-trans isomerase [Candidatus Vogelbacteria bacterium]
MKVAGIIVAIVVVILIIWGVTASMKGSPATTAPVAGNGANVATATTESVLGLQMSDITVGTGEEAKAGDIITVNYLGTLENGTKFDSSYDAGQPFRFQLASGTVIKGWDLGVQGMKVGGKRHLIIAPELAYGAVSPSPLIPANSTLVFDVELMKVERP